MTARTGIPSETRAWACLGANALVLPGLGSLVGRRFLAGVLQLTASLMGFALTMLWFFSFARSAMAEDTLPTDLGPFFRYGVAGLVLFGFAWLWGLHTGLQLVREARARAWHDPSHVPSHLHD